MTGFLSANPMVLPFVACLLLAGIHVYLGIHVISRKVIFVDLALAQIAALGAVVGVVLGYSFEDEPWAIKGFSLTLAFIGAAVFSLTRMKYERVPQEAIIGITYAVAIAATILISSHLPHGPETMEKLLAGDIIWVKPETIYWTALLYGTIGLFHYLFRKQFFSISMVPNVAAVSGVRVRFWDFLFYVSFGFVVTSSVAIAGVLLVFSYLVIPAVIAVLFADKVRRRLAIGWIVGTLVSFVGVTLSWYSDLPSGPTIVVTFGGALVLAGAVYYLWRTPSRVKGALKLGAGAVAVALLVIVGEALRKDHHRSVLDLVRSSVKNERLMVLRQAEADEEIWTRVRVATPELLRDSEAEVRAEILGLVGKYGEAEFLSGVHGLLRDPDDIVREDAIRCVRDLSLPQSVQPMCEAIQVEEDDYLRVEIADTVLELGNPCTIPCLIDVMDMGEAPQVREDAFEHLSAHTDLKLPFHADVPPDRNDDQILAFRQWWEANKGKLSWDAYARRFK